MFSKEKLVLVGGFLLVAFNFFVWKEVLRLDGLLHVKFFDVGQGDSFFLRTPQGHQILIDGGVSGKQILKKLSKEMPFWDRSLDLVVLTHPDRDHLNGLIWVLRKYKAEKILSTGVQKQTKTFQEWKELVKEKSSRVFIAEKGEKILAGFTEFSVLYPFESLQGKMKEFASNDTSLVLKMSLGRIDFLFPGDITKEIELLLVQEYGEFLQSEVLKVAHHGSKNSTSEFFLKKVLPTVAVISVGKENPYHHPHNEVLQRLKRFSIRVLRTDQDGDVEIITNGAFLKVEK